MADVSPRDVELPEMRNSVLDALESLSSQAHQERHWLNPRADDQIQDFLDLSVHILFGDTEVLPLPRQAVGSILFPEDVPPLERLASILEPLIDELGDVPDATYLADRRWTSVIQAASDALADLRQHGHR